MKGDCFGCGDDNPAGLGLRFDLDGLQEVDGRASQTLRAEWTPQAHHRGARGVLHGGLAATALDECMGALSHVLDDRATVTATLALRYRRAVVLGEGTLRVEAWRERAEPRHRNRVHGRLLLPDGVLAVSAVGIFVDVGPAAPTR